MSLSNQERYFVSQAIARTLTQWGDIHAVNLLINNRHPGLDTAATIPLGSLAGEAEGDAAGLWDTASRANPGTGAAYSSMATLYFPVSAGRGIIAEARPITAKDRSLESMALALVEALSVRPANLANTLDMPDLGTLLAGTPVVEETAGSTGRVIRLAFHEGLNETLIAAGIPRSVMMASLTYTLTTFLPYTAGITVTIGSELVTALVPAGLYEGAGEQILFDQGVMQRSQFSHFLLDNCALYFAGPQGNLVKTLRPIPYYQAYNPRYLVNQLMEGPQGTDSIQGLSPVMPEGSRDADLLGIVRQSDTVLVNLTGNILSLSADMDERQERLMVYGMVNTLTQQRGARQVCFFADGLQNKSFAEQIELAGVFYRNEGIIQH